MLAASIATITPVARGATLDASPANASPVAASPVAWQLAQPGDAR